MKRFIAGLLAILVSATLAFAADPKKPTRVPLPVAKAVQGEQCVEPTDVMRRDHMKMILHQRDETMHRGLRTTKHSLKNCVNCHADPKTGSVLGQNGFCESCHSYAAVTMDCFSCHTDKAEKKTGAVREPNSLERLVRLSAPSMGDTP